MGVSANRLGPWLRNRTGRPAPTTTPAVTLPRNETQTPLTQAPPPFQFAPRPATVQPYVTPPRVPGSGTGAQNAFASQRPPGFDPVQAFLATLPPLGPPAQAQVVSQVPMPASPNAQQLLGAIDPNLLKIPRT